MTLLQRLRMVAVLTAFVLTLVAAVLLVEPPKASAGPPADLDKTALVTDLQSPTAFRFTPAGEIIIAEQSGALRLFHDGHLHPAPMVTLPTASTDERGLLGLELDPDYATNHHLYVAYTHVSNYNRLSRLTVTGDSIDLASEVVLLESNQPANVFHHGGEIKFGPDGKLYWGLGMNLYSPNSQNLGTIHGKVLRLNRDGSIPADNPYVDTPGAEPAIWASGLRNPFRFAFVPGGAGANAGKPLVGDVGGSYWEELNVVSKAGNYGWPTYEGACTGCPTINPLFAYPHTDPPSSAGSITAVAVNRGTTLGPAYANAVFYGDYTLGTVRYAVMDEGFTSVLSDHAFDDQAGTPVQLSFGPDGELYQLDIYPGTLSRIGPSGGNRAPVAVAGADVTDGLAPLAVQLSSAGSVDPDGTPLSYAWDFRDGTTSTAPNPAHTFTRNGTYDVTLTVSDGSKQTVATTRVTVGNRAPASSIGAPAAGRRYNAGDTISYSGTATDPEDGTLPASAFSWSVVFHHAEHTHPFLGPINGVRSGSFTVPRNADNLATTSYEIRLTVTDAGGLKSTSSRMVTPNLVDLTFRATPEGATYTIDGVPFTGTHTERAVAGVDRVVGVASPQFIGGSQYAFAGWSDGGAAAHTIRTPAGDQSYRVSLAAVPAPPAPWRSTDVGDRTATGSTGYSDGTFTVRGGGNDVWGDTDELRYVWQPLSGNGSIVARVTGQSNTHPWAKSGVMIKQSDQAGAAYAALGVTPGNGMHLQWDFAGSTGGGAYAFPDAWVKLTRSGSTVTGYRSVDGTTWTRVGSTVLSLTGAATIGLFVSAHDDATLNQTTFEDVTVTDTGPPPGPLPSPWERTDVGGARPEGSAGHTPGGEFTVAGGGTDIWGSADQSSYVHRPLTGDGTIVARVTSQVASDPWAKAGIMVKASTQAGAPYAAMMTTPEHGARFQSEFSVDSSGGAYETGQAWLKLVRAGNTFTGYVSDDGVSWTRVRSRTIAMPATVTAGLFVLGHSAELGGATFDQVSVVANDTSLPTGWSAADLGAATPEGSAAHTGGTFTVTGGGRDIWGTVDEGHLAWKSLNGDGSVVARLTGLDAVDDWAKAGVVIKQSAAAGEPYAALFATKGHGVRLQTSSSSIAGSGSAAPRWLRLTRTGPQLDAHESANGTDWTLVGRVTVPMTASVAAGLVVTGHDGGVTAATATFTDVSVTASGGGPPPAPWTSADVGPVQVPGSASVNGRVFTVRGSGNDVWGDTDEMHLVHQPVTGASSITTRVRTQEDTSDWAKSGIILKASATPGSDYVALAVTPGHGLRMQTRAGRDIAGGSATLPRWIRLERTGSTVVGYRSDDGQTWTEVGRVETTIATSARMGLFVSSHNGPVLNASTFSDVVVVP